MSTHKPRCPCRACIERGAGRVLWAGRYRTRLEVVAWFQAHPAYKGFEWHSDGEYTVGRKDRAEIKLRER